MDQRHFQGIYMKNAIPDDEHFGPVDEEYELVSVVVEYDEQPDQCTIYHPDSTGIERMSNWITADTNSFVDLYGAR